MIIVKKEFQDLLYKQENKQKVYKDIEYIHKYDRQRLKSLLNEQMNADGKDYVFTKKD